ncbi:hypothetical protein HK104_005458 [Borealophlyctis nickersoniae]|nr:hypothetical protein HK104_005458 [Borealophlyctis nickersoniae]
MYRHLPGIYYHIAIVYPTLFVMKGFERQPTQRSDALSRFNILTAKYESIAKELRDPLFKELFVHPSSLPPLDAAKHELYALITAPEVRDPLAEEAAKMYAELNLNVLDETAMENALKDEEAAITKHDEFITSAQDAFNDFLKNLKDGSAEAKNAKRQREDEAIADVEKLNRGIMWMSSGPRSWEEDDRMKERAAKLYKRP